MLGISTLASAWPTPVSNYVSIKVNNLSGAVLPTAIIKKNYGTVMDKNPNPMGLGEFTFVNEGNTYYPAGMTLAIGNSSHLSGQCIISADLLGGGVKQAKDGSDGITCHYKSGNTVAITAVTH